MTLTKTLLILAVFFNFNVALAQDLADEQSIRDLVKETIELDWFLMADDAHLVGALCLPEAQVSEVMEPGEKLSPKAFKTQKWKEYQSFPAKMVALNNTLATIKVLDGNEQKMQAIDKVMGSLEFFSEVCAIMPSIYANYLSYTMGGRQCVGPEGQTLSQEFFDKIKDQCVDMDSLLISTGIGIFEKEIEQYYSTTPATDL